MPTSVEVCRVLLLYDTLMHPNRGGLDNFREACALTWANDSDVVSHCKTGHLGAGHCSLQMINLWGPFCTLNHLKEKDWN